MVLPHRNELYQLGTSTIRL